MDLHHDALGRHQLAELLRDHGPITVLGGVQILDPHRDSLPPPVQALLALIANARPPRARWPRAPGRGPRWATRAGRRWRRPCSRRRICHLRLATAAATLQLPARLYDPPLRS